MWKLTGMLKKAKYANRCAGWIVKPHAWPCVPTGNKHRTDRKGYRDTLELANLKVQHSPPYVTYTP